MKILILGAGQLARMLALAGEAMGFSCYAYDIAKKQIVDPIQGRPYTGKLNEWIESVDVITAEFEHIDSVLLSVCQQSGKLQPSQHAIEIGGDRTKEKALLETLNIANAPHTTLSQSRDLPKVQEKLGEDVILKTAKGGYDGKGQWRIKNSKDVALIEGELQIFFSQHPQAQIVAEQCIPFEEEVSIVGARNAQGDWFTYPLSRNRHHNGVLVQSTVTQSNHPLQTQANEIFEKIVRHLNYQGVLAIEFFVYEGKLLVNELAPRVHNSGHWTQLGATSSQFTEHLKAICGKPLTSPNFLAPTAMINLLGNAQLPQALWSQPNAQGHWYQKAPRQGRKMGHINLQAQTSEALEAQIAHFKTQLLPDELTYL